MFCPVCSQEQASDESRFCSRCGFLLTGISQLIANGGVLPQLQTVIDEAAVSPRKKGIKQGAQLFFLSFIVIPLLAIISIALEIEPFLVAAAFILLTVGGILRMLYARLFESNQPNVTEESVLPEFIQKVIPGRKQSRSLPAQQNISVSSYVPPAATNWRDTNDLTVPPSVTEPTTRLLQKDE